MKHYRAGQAPETSHAEMAPFEEGSGQTEDSQLIAKFDKSYKRTNAINKWNTSHKRHFPKVKSTK